MCEIIEDEKDLIKIDHLRVRQMHTNTYLLQNPQLAFLICSSSIEMLRRYLFQHFVTFVN
jgi:hypothetical protein